MPPRPRRHLRGLTPAVHGAIGPDELTRHGLVDVLDFSVSTNPYGPSPAVLAALRDVDPGRYPDPDAGALRRALAARCGVSPDWVAVGNGSSELIWALVAAYLEPGAPALVIAPTFGEYAAAITALGGTLVEWRASAATGFAVDTAALRARCATLQPRLIFLCNPNNPTGALLQAGEVASLLAACPETLLVVDESYRAFVDEPPDLTPLLPSGNLVLLRSLTKEYALAGLRLGYALGPPETIAALRVVRPAWSVNSAARDAGLAALADEAHRRRSLALMREARAFLWGELRALGPRVQPPTANFLLVDVGDGAMVRAALLRHGCAVRDCASFGLPAYIRIGVRPPPDCERLLAALRVVLAGREATVSATHVTGGVA